MTKSRSTRFYAVLFSLLMLATLGSACRKTEDDTTEEIITETEAAEITETAVAERSGGVVLTTTETTETLTASAQICGATGDTSIQRSKTTGVVTYNQQSQLHWTIQCTNLIPQTAQATLIGSGSFATGHWQGANQATGNLTIAGLPPQNTAYTVSGNYARTGNITGDLRNSNPTFNCVTTVNLTALTIRKSDDQITGGQGTVTIVATATNGESATLTGNLTFNGDGTATVVIQGHSHTFPLQ